MLYMCDVRKEFEIRFEKISPKNMEWRSRKFPQRIRDSIRENVRKEYGVEFDEIFGRKEFEIRFEKISAKNMEWRSRKFLATDSQIAREISNFGFDLNSEFDLKHMDQ